MNKQTTPPVRKAYDPDKLQALLQYIGRLLPNDKERAAFYQCSRTPPPASLRLNDLQAQAQHVRPHLHQCGQRVPWCSEGFALPESDVNLGQTIEHAMGAYYVQAKAPMLAVEVLAPQPGERVLDLCAAPGGKATQLAARMQNSGLLLANELQRKRMPALVGNLERCGVANHVLTQAPGTHAGALLPQLFRPHLSRCPLLGRRHRAQRPEHAHLLVAARRPTPRTAAEGPLACCLSDAAPWRHLSVLDVLALAGGKRRSAPRSVAPL